MYPVRDASRDDVSGIHDIDVAVVGRGTPTDILIRAINGEKLAVADLAGQIVGYVRWDYFWDEMPLCVMVRVHPDHRRSGLGRRLYDHIEESFRRLGCRFWLSSTDETNVRSQKFHEAYGFRRIGALAELGQSVVEIFYRKDID